jgi:chitin synthase
MSTQAIEDSLPSLPLHEQSDTGLTQHLARRFHAHLPTARLSSQALITLNTYTSATSGPNGGEEGSAAAATKDLASRLWARLGHRQENQAVLFLYVFEQSVDMVDLLTWWLGVNRERAKPQSGRIS